MKPRKDYSNMTSKQKYDLIFIWMPYAKETVFLDKYNEMISGIQTDIHTYNNDKDSKKYYDASDVQYYKVHFEYLCAYLLEPLIKCNIPEIRSTRVEYFFKFLDQYNDFINWLNIFESFSNILFEGMNPYYVCYKSLNHSTTKEFSIYTTNDIFTKDCLILGFNIFDIIQKYKHNFNKAIWTLLNYYACLRGYSIPMNEILKFDMIFWGTISEGYPLSIEDFNNPDVKPNLKIKSLMRNSRCDKKIKDAIKREIDKITIDSLVVE